MIAVDAWIEMARERASLEDPREHRALVAALVRVVRGLGGAAPMDGASVRALAVLDAWTDDVACVHALSEADDTWQRASPSEPDDAAAQWIGHVLRTAIYQDHEDGPSDVLEAACDALARAGMSEREIEDKVMGWLTQVDGVSADAVRCPTGECAMRERVVEASNAVS